MTSRDVELIRDTMKLRPPPSDLGLLHEIAMLEWIGRSDDEVDVYCDLLLRVNADVIVCSSDINGSERDKYMAAFRNIATKIDSSNLINSCEFSEYFRKFKDYMLDFN